MIQQNEIKPIDGGGGNCPPENQMVSIKRRIAHICGTYTHAENHWSRWWDCLNGGHCANGLDTNMLTRFTGQEAGLPSQRCNWVVDYNVPHNQCRTGIKGPGRELFDGGPF